MLALLIPSLLSQICSGPALLSVLAAHELKVCGHNVMCGRTAWSNSCATHVCYGGGQYTMGVGPVTLWRSCVNKQRCLELSCSCEQRFCVHAPTWFQGGAVVVQEIIWHVQLLCISYAEGLA
jgi:hypothetical protein